MFGTIADIREQSKELFERYERHLSSAGLILGFIADSLTFQRVDLWFGNLALFFYIAVAASGIALINLYEERVVRGNFFAILYYWAPILVQYAFGGLFSGFVIFYTTSASLSSSWPFLLLLVGILVGNEFFKKRYLHLAFPVSIFFLALFSFFIFYLPILVGEMGARMFLLSGIASLMAIGLFLYVLSLFVSVRVRQSRRALFWGIGSVYVAVNILYFANIIPPIPLSLKDAGVYHSVRRDGGGYLVEGESQTWMDFFTHVRVHLRKGEPVYVFSAVFAPTKLDTEIIHHWQYYHEESDEWVTVSRSSFSIVGGRDGGYRGYSFKSNPAPGWWRGAIETSRGQRVGRVTFKVEHVLDRPDLVTETR